VARSTSTCGLTNPGTLRAINATLNIQGSGNLGNAVVSAAASGSGPAPYVNNQDRQVIIPPDAARELDQPASITLSTRPSTSRLMGQHGRHHPEQHDAELRRQFSANWRDFIPGPGSILNVVAFYTATQIQSIVMRRHGAGECGAITTIAIRSCCFDATRGRVAQRGWDLRGGTIVTTTARGVRISVPRTAFWTG